MSERYETVVLSSEVKITLSIFSIFPIRLATLNDLRSLLKEFVTLEMERIMVYTWKSLLSLTISSHSMPISMRLFATPLNVQITGGLESFDPCWYLSTLIWYAALLRFINTRRAAHIQYVGVVAQPRDLGGVHPIDKDVVIDFATHHPSTIPDRKKL
ncbi:hypothetical protein QIS74_08478 [Colletotrichum tabaci]|uniref:Uncharacterized protein n=1 Tax=Colletotrichum tabaci TaxID=1209068 RepID=A0AAV9TBQ2_9PEZI